MSEKLEIEVVGGFCKIRFSPGSSTGPSGCETSPGVGFDLVSDVPTHEMRGKFFHGAGVIGRSDAAALRDMLEIFLKTHARGEQR